MYPFVAKGKLKNVDVEFQAEVEYWASTNHLQDYKIYGTMIKMFMSKFLNNLPQPPRNNPWLPHSTNKKYKTRFHQQCDSLLRFQTPKKINDSIFFFKWPRNESNAKDDLYETSTFAYNREMDQLVEANTIINEVEEEDSIECVNVKMMELDDENENIMP